MSAAYRRGASISSSRADRRWTSLIYSPRLKLVDASQLPGLAEHGRVAAARFETHAREVVAASVHAPTTRAVVAHLDVIFDAIAAYAGDTPLIVGGDLSSCRLAEEAWPG